MTGFNVNGTMLFSRHQPGGAFVFASVDEVPGTIIFCDSNSSTGSDAVGYGKSPDLPVLTLDFAIGLCTADQGDIILLAPGHSETLTTLITLDVAGVKIIGIGLGALRAQLTINANIDGIDVQADNCLIRGLYYNEATNAHTASINVGAANLVIEYCHFDLGVNDLETITVEAAGKGLRIRDDCSCLITADGPDALMEIEDAGVDDTIIEGNNFIGSDGTNAFDAAIINSGVANSNLVVRKNWFSGDGQTTACVTAASATGLVVGPNYYGGSATNADNATEESSLGSANDTTTDSIHGKLGTDTELGDRSLYDILNDAGPTAFDAAAAPANDISGFAVLRAIYNLVVPTIIIGEADIDEDQAVYTNFINLVTIVPAGGAPLSDVRIVFDLDKTTDGWADKAAAETLQLAVARKVDGTNWVRHADGASSAIAGNDADGDSIELVIGDVGVTEEVRIEVILSAEGPGDVEFPFALSYKALAAPTVTPVAAV